ncbi:MAG: hypothetical protein ACREGI_03890 [Candidatus Levyibacteriota bacterium]
MTPNEQQGFSEEQLEQMYGPQLLSFEHTYEDDSGERHTETLSVRRLFTFSTQEEGGEKKRAELSVVDSNGQRLVLNTSSWSYQDGHVKDVYSLSTYSNTDENETDEVAIYNVGPNRFRVVPGAAAAMIAHVVTNPLEPVPVWYSQTPVNLSDEWEHSGRHMYEVTLNKWYGPQGLHGHLVESVFEEGLDRFAVRPIQVPQMRITK